MNYPPPALPIPSCTSLTATTGMKPPSTTATGSAAGVPRGGGFRLCDDDAGGNEPSGLVVFPTHRLVRGVADFDPKLLGCAAYFDILPQGTAGGCPGPRSWSTLIGRRRAFGFYTGGYTFTLLTLRDPAVMENMLPGLSPASRGLDVNVLHTLILERLLGIDKANMASQTNLTYTRGLREALDDVNAGAYQCAFLLNPTRVEIRDVAAAGKMPQKSTYFYPKLITGLTVVVGISPSKA